MSWRCPHPMPGKVYHVLSCACVGVPRTSVGRCAGIPMLVNIVRRDGVIDFLLAAMSVNDACG